MIEYTSETTAKITTKRYQFFLDSSESGLPEHAQMLEDFKDESKLKIFCDLLEDNHKTAFLTYINTTRLSF
jgi:hypothetical protein